MTEEQFLTRFPHASQDTIRENIACGNITRANRGASVAEGNGDIPESGEPLGSQNYAGIRQRAGPKLNKTEAAFLEWLHARHDPKEIRAQSVTLLLGNGVRYTPDFTHLKAGLAWETKGLMRDDAAVKLKVAASLYPEIKFHLVTRQKLKDGGQWNIREVFA